MGRLEKLLQNVKAPPALTPKQVRLRSLLLFGMAILLMLLSDQITTWTGDIYVILPIISVALVLLGFYALLTGKLPNRKRS